MKEVYFYLYHGEIEFRAPTLQHGFADIVEKGEIKCSAYFESLADAANDRVQRKFPLTPVIKGYTYSVRSCADRYDSHMKEVTK